MVSLPEAHAYSAAKSLIGREIECDVMVAGGGLSGICAAISAALNSDK